VDNDPIVLAHARALLTGTAEGAIAYIDAGVRDTGSILRTAAGTLDFSKPVAVMVLCVMQYVPGSAGPHQIVSRRAGRQGWARGRWPAPTAADCRRRGGGCRARRRRRTRSAGGCCRPGR
jgi:S-adenosyl methyltransferase